MDKDKDYIDIGQPEDDALRLMEQSGGESPADVERMLENEECLDACKDLWMLKNVIQDRNVKIPDVDNEWDKFINNKRPSSRRQYIWGVVSGVAATLLVVFSVVAWQKLNANKDILAYEASGKPAIVTLKAVDSGALVVGNDSTCLDALSGHISQTDSSLTYSNADKAEPVQQHLLTTSRGKTFKVTLSDGTTVWLNASSSLSYPTRFEGNIRTVTVTGEAYFQVARNEKMPFVVETERMRTKVLGTEFNVKAYANAISHVTLVKGCVDVTSKIGHSTRRMKPGEDLTIGESGSMTSRTVDTDVYHYWKEGFFFFDNSTVAEIMKSLGEWYDMNVVFRNHSIMNHHMHYFCERTGSVEEALAMFNAIGKPRARCHDNTIYIE